MDTVRAQDNLSRDTHTFKWFKWFKWVNNSKDTLNVIDRISDGKLPISHLHNENNGSGMLSSVTRHDKGSFPVCTPTEITD